MVAYGGIFQPYSIFRLSSRLLFYLEPQHIVLNTSDSKYLANKLQNSKTFKQLMLPHILFIDLFIDPSINLALPFWL